MPGKQVRYKGHTIHYQVTGAGPVLLLLHGFLESSGIWDAISSRLARKFFVIAPDLPGHGRSDILGQDHSMENMAAAVRVVLEEESVRHFVEIGHSMGGYVALALGKMMPDSVKGICLFHSHAEQDSADGKLARDRTIDAVNRSHTWFIRQFIPDLFAPSNVARCASTIKRLQQEASRMIPEAITLAISGMRDRPDSVKWLAGSEIPLMFLAGKEDKRMPYEKVLYQAAQLPECALHLIRDAGHMGWAEEPDRCFRAIESFTASCQ